MGCPVEYWSRCNEKFSAIIKSTRLSLLLTTLIFLSVSSASAEEPRRCYWCGPLAEQVHRSRRARPCAAPLQEIVCDEPHHYCATVALGPPYTESRLCVKKYQDECYILYCNTTRTYKMTCPCRGDFCNGPNTPREEAAFKQLRQLAASSRTKRFIKENLNTTAAPTLPPMNRIDQTDLVTNYTDSHFGNAIRDEMSISTLNSSQKSGGSEVIGASTAKTHETMVNESDLNNEVENNQNEAKKETKRSGIQTNVTVDTTTQTDHETSEDKKLTVSSMNMSTVVDIINSNSGFNETTANQHANMTTEHNKVNETNDTSSQEIYRSITTEQSTAYSTEINVNGTSEKPSDSDDLHLRNEIPTEHEVPNPKDDKEVKVQPSVPVPVENATVDTTTQTDLETSADQKLNVTSMNNSTTGFNETIANHHANVTENNKVNKPNDTSNQEIYRSITTEQSTAYSTEVIVKVTSEKSSEGDNFHLRNEIPIKHEVLLTKVPASENPINETNHDMKENNKEQRLNTSEASLNEITITKQDTNTNSSHSIVILDQQVESTADEMDSNFDETCNKTQTCNVNETSTAQTEKSKKTDKETQFRVKETMVKLPEIKEVTTENPYSNTAATEAKTSNESKNSFDTPAIAATTNPAKPLESATSLFTTLPSKVVTSTEANSTLGIKKCKQTSKKNKAFTVGGSILLLAHTFVVIVAL